MLEAMREEKTTARVFPSMSARNTLPRALRRELKEAGVARIELT